MQYYANFIGDRWCSMKKATLYAKESHTSKVILTFSIFLFHFIAGRKKISLVQLFTVLLKAAAFRLCELAPSILANEKQEGIDKFNSIISPQNQLKTKKKDLHP